MMMRRTPTTMKKAKMTTRAPKRRSSREIYCRQNFDRLLEERRSDDATETYLFPHDAY
jgi:hypothetical protein